MLKEMAKAPKWTGWLLEHGPADVVAHFIYVSIVGVDRIPLDYYQRKLAAEALVQETGLP